MNRTCNRGAGPHSGNGGSAARAVPPARKKEKGKRKKERSLLRFSIGRLLLRLRFGCRKSAGGGCEPLIVRCNQRTDCLPRWPLCETGAMAPTASLAIGLGVVGFRPG